MRRVGGIRIEYIVATESRSREGISVGGMEVTEDSAVKDFLEILEVRRMKAVPGPSCCLPPTNKPS